MRDHRSLSGTIRNCAGGPTPWGSWMTCEETTDVSPARHAARLHLRRAGRGTFSDPTPMRDMGRYSHEALAVDPATGYIYETEDAGDSSGFYRYVPNTSATLGRRRTALHAEGRERQPRRTSAASYRERHRPSTSSGCRSTRPTTRRPRCRATSSGHRAARRARRRSRGSKALVRQRREDLHRLDQRRRRAQRADLGIRPEGGNDRAAVPVAGRGGAECAGQHHASARAAVWCCAKTAAAKSSSTA